MFKNPERKKNYVIPGFGYMDVVGTTPWKEKVELCREQQPRVESGSAKPALVVQKPRSTQEAKAETRYHGNDNYQDIEQLEILN